VSLAYVRNFFQVPAYRGRRVRYTDSRGAVFFGTIKSATAAGRLRVLVDDRVPGYRGRLVLHPLWNVEYLEPQQ
jgi:protocatechuate 3,4-dioxygenase beta subunit